MCVYIYIYIDYLCKTMFLSSEWRQKQEKHNCVSSDFSSQRPAKKMKLNHVIKKNVDHKYVCICTYTISFLDVYVFYIHVNAIIYVYSMYIYIYMCVCI